MKVSNLFVCDRCGLQFVADEPPNLCPACLRHHTGPTVIRLAGRNVSVESVKLYGENPLRGRGMVRGLADLRLGCRCPHGWIIQDLCSTCNAAS